MMNFQFFSRHLPILSGLGLLVLLGLSGCGGQNFHPVTGKVTIFGVGPLTSGEIRFQPVSRPDLVATGQIQRDGTFKLSTPEHGDAVLAGQCRVAILVDPSYGKQVIHERFRDYSTSDMRYTVEDRNPNYYEILVFKP